ncbi:MAG: hypothetical protein K2X38_12965 [Gemmataceae bacterium]|nr:hypothetical protein [Gemmataceae bacterium]
MFIAQWRGRAIRTFFRDLADGDPVAIAFVLAILAVVAFLGVYGFFVLRNRRLEDEKRKAKYKRKQDNADKGYKKLKGKNEI